MNSLTNDKNKNIPCAIELERAVIGAILMDENAIANAVGINEHCFHPDRHKAIFRAASALTKKQIPIDVATVMEQLKSTGELASVGGPSYLVELTNLVASSANIEAHTRILIQYGARRRLIESCDTILAKAYDLSSDPLEMLADAESKVFSIGTSFHSTKVYGADVVGKMVLDEFDKTAALDHNQTTGIPSGIIGLDKLMNGLQKSDLGVIAARPGMGKTALILNMMHHMSVVEKKAGAVFSLEMSALQLGQRIVAIDSEIPNYVLKDGRKASEDQKVSIVESAGRFSNSPIWIDDTPGPNVYQIRSKARLLKLNHNIEYILVDYLQLMSPIDRRVSMDVSVGEMSRGLKEMAKELDVPVIAISQLSRAVEARANKIPVLSDLRSSGNIEQDADWITFLFRPAYYGITVDANDDKLPEGITYLIVAKNRHGELKNINLKFTGETMKFTDHVDEEFEPDHPVAATSEADDLPF